MRLAECLESLGLNDYQKLRLHLAAQCQQSLIRIGWDADVLKAADQAVAQAEALLEELGIPDPDIT